VIARESRIRFLERGFQSRASEGLREFSRVEDRVVFSMPVGGGGTAEPRLQIVWVSADAIDWQAADAAFRLARPWPDARSREKA